MELGESISYYFIKMFVTYLKFRLLPQFSVECISMLRMSWAKISIWSSSSMSVVPRYPGVWQTLSLKALSPKMALEVWSVFFTLVDNTVVRKLILSCSENMTGWWFHCGALHHLCFFFYVWPCGNFFSNCPSRIPDGWFWKTLSTNFSFGSFQRIH